MPQPVVVGRQGKDVRSDCWIQFQGQDSGGIRLNLKSKVEIMYGHQIRQLIYEVLDFYKIKHAVIDLEDQGALPFVLLARLETAIKRFWPEKDQEFLPPLKSYCCYGTIADRFRRTRLYLPGNEPKFMINAGLHQPDGIILDLEDSVAPTEKDAARILVRNALRQVNFMGAERLVRINQSPAGLEDLKYIVPHHVHVILIPKCESASQVETIENAVQTLCKKSGRTEPVYYMPIIESAHGAIQAYEIARASKNNVALAIGLEDYTADIGTERTLEGRESFWARMQVVNAARAAGIQPIDTVFGDINDMQGLQNSVLEAKALGFDGKGCIHPRQIRIVHEAFRPTETELERAKNIVKAFEKATAEGLGVISIGSKMIDAPVVKRAQRTVKLALMSGILDENWREGGASNAA
ncbi:HpcH/HpaI aldolase/citrate lyase family protein [candidate division KSB1 bacterium]|nr:HpcH/HpaI aldolase/citrate lyase family protein [candidate division KSB1 bacterium]